MLADLKEAGCASVAEHAAQGWEAKLALGFARQHSKTVLARRPAPGRSAGLQGP